MKCAHTILFMLLLTAVAPAPAEVVTTNAEESTISAAADWRHLGGLFDLTGTFGTEIDGRYRIADRLLDGDRWTLWVTPAPRYSTTVEASIFVVAPIFADDFERGAPSGWSSTVGYRRGGGEMFDPVRPYWIWHLTDGTDDYLVSDAASGLSDSGDTPASTRIIGGAEMSAFLDWVAFEWAKDDTGRNAFALPGGVVKHRQMTITLQNDINPDTNVGSLDYLEGVDFRRQEAKLYACYPAGPSATNTDLWSRAALAGSLCDVAFVGTVTTAGFGTGGRNRYSATVREQTEDALQTPTTPYLMPGLGRAVKMEVGGPDPGPEIGRRDIAALRSTGDQWYAWALYGDQDDLLDAEYPIFVAPLIKLLRDPSGATVDLNVEMLDSTNSWVPIVGSIDWSVGQRRVLVNYDSNTQSAELWLDGVSQGSTSLTGGLYASAATAETLWYADPSSGSVDIRHYFFRHGTRLLADAEVEDRSLYSFDFANETGLSTAIEFNNGVGTRADDMAGNAVAELRNFADADGAWLSSALGEAGQSKTRLPAIAGRPFNAPAIVLDKVFLVYTAGYAGSAVDTVGGVQRKARYVALGGARLRAPLASRVLSSSFFAVGSQVDLAPMLAEYAYLQKLTGTSAGANSGDLTVRTLLIDPVTFEATTGASTGTILMEEALTDDAARSTTWTLGGSADWSTPSGTSPYDTAADGLFPTFELAQPFDGRLSVGLAGSSGDSSWYLTELFLRKLGPEAASVTATDIQAIDARDVGWIGDGAAAAAKHAPDVARSEVATDGGPSVIYRTTAAAWVARGFDRTPASQDYTWREAEILRAVEVPHASRVASVRVNYARNWSFAENSSAQGFYAAEEDAFATAVASKWRSVTSGSGSPEWAVEGFMLKRDDAQTWADALLDIAQNGRLYEITFKGYRPRSEVVGVEPFDVADVTFNSGTPGSYLGSGRKGCIVGYKVTPGGTTALVLFVGT